jgi:hypothetical protein
MADEFGRNLVESACHFDVSVAMDNCAGLLGSWERVPAVVAGRDVLLQNRLDPFARRAIDASSFLF